MDYPIMLYQDVFIRIHDILPSDRFISKEELDLMSEDNITILRIYFFYTVPFSLTNYDYECLRHLLELVSKVLYTIEDGEIVIAPGDSPSKIINLINMLYQVDTDIYEYVDRTNETESNVRKYIKFVSFPLSKLTSATDPVLLDNYLNEVLITNGININEISRLSYIDHIHMGASRKELEKSFQRMTSNMNFILTTINLESLMTNILPYGRQNGCYSTYMDAIAETEVIGARCVAKYKLGSSMVHPNLLRCNMINSMLYLLAIGRINTDLKLPTINPDDLWNKIEGKIVKISYYDNYSLKFEQKTDKFRYSPEGYLFNNSMYIQINSITNVEITPKIKNNSQSIIY